MHNFCIKRGINIHLKWIVFFPNMKTMKCLSCSDINTKVIDSRATENSQTIRRRRECESCHFRFTTFERVQTSQLTVEKKDGSFEPYIREKIEKSILIACAKRPVYLNTVREHLSDCEEKWVRLKNVKSAKIGEYIMDFLKEIDEVTFIRFASVYKKFKDIESFKRMECSYLL